MIHSPLLEGIRDEIRLGTIRDLVRENLALRFGEVSEDRLAALEAMGDEKRLRALNRLGVTGRPRHQAVRPTCPCGTPKTRVARSPAWR